MSQLEEIRVRFSSRDAAETYLLPLQRTTQQALDNQGNGVELRGGEVKVDSGGFESWYQLSLAVAAGTGTFGLSVLAGCLSTWLMSRFSTKKDAPRPTVVVRFKDGTTVMLRDFSRVAIRRTLEGRPERSEELE